MKAELRNRAKKILLSLEKEALSQKSSLIAKSLSEYLNNLQLNSSGATTIGVYSPLKGEVLWFEQLQLNGDFHFAVAHVVDETQMEFHPVHLEIIKAKKLGIKLEEDYRAVPVVPDIVLVPGLAFTADCNRLGRGKGYYDRYLAGYQGIKIGLCFKEQIFPQLPIDAFDVAMDLVITDDNIYRPKG